MARSCRSVTKLAECSHGKRVLVGPHYFWHPFDTFNSNFKCNHCSSSHATLTFRPLFGGSNCLACFGREIVTEAYGQGLPL